MALHKCMIDCKYAHTISLTLNVKQGFCDYQLLRLFGLTLGRNRTQVYRLRGGH